MPWNRTKAQEVRKKVRVDYGDDGDINIEFYPDRYTPAHEDMVDAVREKGDGGNAATFCALILPLLAGWDIMEDKEVNDANPKKPPVVEQQVIPLTEDSIRSLPYHILSDITKAITGALTPGETVSAESEGSFH